ncbi:hypothetical protein Tco_0011477 [Tanacetum coccineum]
MATEDVLLSHYCEPCVVLNETVPQVEPPKEGQPSNALAVQTTTTQELWESLERKYKIEDASTKKFVIAYFLDYKMVDSKNVITQVEDMHVLLHDIHAEGMTLKDNKLALKNTYTPDSAKDNMVEHVGSSSKSNSKGKGKGKGKNDKKRKGKAESLAPKAGIIKQKFHETCYNCN